MPAPKRLGIKICSLCSGPCLHETYTLEHRFLDEEERRSAKVWCSLEHMLTELFENHCMDKVEDTIRKELRTLHAKVCFACALRLPQLEEQG